MMNEVEIKQSKSFAILPAIGLTVLLLFFIYSEKGKLFDWSHFNPNGINTIIFLLFFVLGLLSWYNYFDTAPYYRIDKSGIWYRKSWFAKKLQSLAAWDKMEYFFIEQVNDKIFTETLIIKLTDKEKYFKVSLTGSSITKEELLSIILEQSKKFNFQDLGVECNRYSKYK